MRVEALTHRGLVREANEDAFLVETTVGLLAVADGLGGHRAGEVASRLALRELVAGLGHRGLADDLALDEALRQAVERANEAIYRESLKDPHMEGMGTTLTAALVHKGNCHLAHVGDSRAYLWRGGRLTLLTSDHSLVGEMLRNGQVSEAEAQRHPQRNVLTRALGTGERVVVDVASLEVFPGDRLLLCSDGLSSTLDLEVLSREVAGANLGQIPQRLLELALRQGGEDNITVVLAEVS